MKITKITKNVKNTHNMWWMYDVQAIYDNINLKY